MIVRSTDHVTRTKESQINGILPDTFFFDSAHSKIPFPEHSITNSDDQGGLKLLNRVVYTEQQNGQPVGNHFLLLRWVCCSSKYCIPFAVKGAATLKSHVFYFFVISYIGCEPFLLIIYGHEDEKKFLEPSCFHTNTKVK